MDRWDGIEEVVGVADAGSFAGAARALGMSTSHVSRAVARLEEAVELEPGVPEINDHLGDAYWRVGRQVEARYQWQRVLTLEPDDKQKAAAQAKLKDGLDGSTAPTSVAKAG